MSSSEFSDITGYDDGRQCPLNAVGTGAVAVEPLHTRKMARVMARKLPVERTVPTETDLARIDLGRHRISAHEHGMEPALKDLHESSAQTT